MYLTMGNIIVLCDWAGIDMWQMCPKCHEHSQDVDREVASITEKKKNADYLCSLSPEISTFTAMSGSSAPNFVYSRKKLQSNCATNFSAQGNDSYSCPLSFPESHQLVAVGLVSEGSLTRQRNLQGNSVAISSEQTNKNCSCSLSFPVSHQLAAVGSVPEDSVPNLVYRRRKLQRNSAAIFSEQSNRNCSCPLSLPVSHQLAAAGSVSEVSVPNLVYRRRKVQGSCAAIFSDQTSRNGKCPLNFPASHQIAAVGSVPEGSVLNLVYRRRKLQGNSDAISLDQTNRNYSHPLSFPASHQLAAVGSVSEGSVPNLVYKRRKLEGNSAAIFPEQTNRNSSCPLNFSVSHQPSTVISMSGGSVPNLVYRRRKPQGNSSTIFSAQAPARTKRSGDDCLSVISSDAPSVAIAEQHVDCRGDCETEAVGVPIVALGSDKPSQNTRKKITEVDSTNDSCSSSNPNMEGSASTKLEVDDICECSSSSVRVAEFTGECLSEKDLCISIIRRQRVFNGNGLNSTCASAKGVCDGSGSSSSRFCKICGHKEYALKMLICDNCHEAFHLFCCNPRVRRIPIDEWFCNSCLKKKHKVLKEAISRKSPNFVGGIGSRRNASSTDELNPIELMMRDTQPYKSDVRVGKGFQAEVPDWTGPIKNDIDTIGEPLEMDPSDAVSLQSNQRSKLGSMGNWLQCRAVIDGVDGTSGAICGKWRRAPLFEVQTVDWECFCSVLWDPIHADCAVPQELKTDQILNQLKNVKLLRSRLATKRAENRLQQKS